jgi:hypothetical protein
MKPRHQYLVRPLGEAYNNNKEIAGVKIVTNTSIEDAKFVNRIGVVVSVPINNTEEISVGDRVVLHHNVFRTYLNMKGKKTKSNEYFRDGLYLVGSDRIFLYNSGDSWKTISNYCFVKPVEKVQDKSYIQIEKTQENTGELCFANDFLQSIGLSDGQRVGFTKNSEYEFEIDGEKMYRMRNEDICLTITQTE